jgi:hypothetical protein
LKGALSACEPLVTHDKEIQSRRIDGKLKLWLLKRIPDLRDFGRVGEPTFGVDDMRQLLEHSLGKAPLAICQL